jgi:GSH-dependent disulfide-bond oxidoreductase
VTLQLHYFPTLNGHKAAIALEEMGLAYEVVFVDILNGGQHDPAFRAINPNSRIPALADPDVTGEPVCVFESAAILQYLGRKTGRFYPADEPTRARIDSWLFWQMAGLGPMSGQVNYFTRAAAKPGRDPAETTFAIHRYRKETARLFGVLENGLEGRDYICGDYSIADMCIWPWIEKYPDNGGGLAAFPNIAAWHARIAARPAVARALTVGMDLVAQDWARREGGNLV